jgi:hypothetical protein
MCWTEERNEEFIKVALLSLFTHAYRMLENRCEKKERREEQRNVRVMIVST